jgi:hypothetical protein
MNEVERRQKQLGIIKEYLGQFGIIDKTPELLSNEVVQLLASFIIKEKNNVLRRA